MGFGLAVRTGPEAVDEDVAGFSPALISSRFRVVGERGAENLVDQKIKISFHLVRSRH
jgi:hypothetical protein